LGGRRLGTRLNLVAVVVLAKKMLKQRGLLNQVAAVVVLERRISAPTLRVLDQRGTPPPWVLDQRGTPRQTQWVCDGAIVSRHYYRRL
jgi:hypothetical protein